MKINSITPNYYTKSQKSYDKDNNKAPSFKGTVVPEPVTKGLSSFYEKVVSTSGFQKFIKAFSNSNKTFTHLLVAESCFLSGFYMINTLRNKKIEKEQKPQMLINDALTLGVSTAGAYLVEDKITDAVMKGSEKYFKKYSDFYIAQGRDASASAKGSLLKKVTDIIGQKDTEKFKQGLDEAAAMVGSYLKNLVGEEGKLKTFQITEDRLKEIQESVKKAISDNKGCLDKAKDAVKGTVDDVYNNASARAEAEKVLPGINKLKVLVIFGIIYRYLGPVVITPIANKISSKFFSKEADKKS